MTLPSERIGDKEQRYEVSGRVEETGAAELLAYCDTEERARQLVKAFKQWPRYDGVWLVDRSAAAPPVSECSS